MKQEMSINIVILRLKLVKLIKRLSIKKESELKRMKILILRLLRKEDNSKIWRKRKSLNLKNSGTRNQKSIRFFSQRIKEQLRTNCYIKYNFEFFVKY